MQQPDVRVPSVSKKTGKAGATKDDSHTDYHAAKLAASAAMERGVWRKRFSPRFVKLEDRQMRCDLPRHAIDAVARGKHFASYRGLPMAKDPLDRVLYETLFYEVRPGTVIELGAYTGASAIWMADVLKTFKIDSRVIAVDVDLELVDDSARLHGGVDFLEGDLNSVDDLFPTDFLSELEGPIVLIDDAHVNIAEVYSHFDRHALSSGDYLVIEDTIPWIPASFGVAESEDGGATPEESSDEAESRADETLSDWGDWKWDEVSAFFDQCDAEYLVDRYYADFFGYNATWNWNGFLRKS